MFCNLSRISKLPYIIRSYCLTQRNNPIVLSNSLSRLYCKDASKGSSDDPKSKKEKCPGPSKMDMLPKPECPWDPEYDEANKKHKKHLILGILFAAVTLAVLWYNVKMTKEVKDDKKRITRRPKPTCRIPKNAEDIPDTVPYLLIGGGTASFSAFRAIKSNDPTAKVLVVSNECYFPYMRPPLSKEMWFNTDDKNVEKLIFKQWNGTERSLYYEPQDFYIPVVDLKSNVNGGVSVIQGYTIKKIDVVEKVAYLDNGRAIKYDKCLIATGGKPKNLPLFAAASEEIQNKVTLYRDIFDFTELYEICKEVKSVAIIGGGFLGSELACALGKLSEKYDLKIYQIFKENGNMGKVLPEYLSEWTTNKIRAEKVNIINRTEVEDAVLNEKQRLVLHLNNGKKLVVDHVVCAIGVQPNTQLAKTSDLEVDPELDGFLVNAEMEARSNLYVAGDCSCFYDIKLGRRRVEHHDHAVVSGRLAGENMTGAAKPYLHQSMFWSDLGPSIGYEAIGRVDSKLPTVAVFAKAGAKDNPQAVVTATDNNLRSTTEEEAGSSEGKLVVKQLSSETPIPQNTATPSVPGHCDNYGKGVIFYLKDDIVVGIVLWNVFNRMSIARQVLKEERKYDDLNEVAKLFNIHED